MARQIFWTILRPDPCQPPRGWSGQSQLVRSVLGQPPAVDDLLTLNHPGSFRIYRAPGSVAFLNCGNALQPILPKSQCWCIAEDSSQFVLQIRRPQYWRIEVPVQNQDDLENALVLKEVFDKILLFEKTECPFQRSFTVELPAKPTTPVKKRPWTPVGKNLIPSVFTSDLSPPAPPPKIVVQKRRPRSPLEEQMALQKEQNEATVDDVEASPDVRKQHDTPSTNENGQRLAKEEDETREGVLAKESQETIMEEDVAIPDRVQGSPAGHKENATETTDLETTASFAASSPPSEVGATSEPEATPGYETPATQFGDPIAEYYHGHTKPQAQEPEQADLVKTQATVSDVVADTAAHRGQPSLQAAEMSGPPTTITPSTEPKPYRRSSNGSDQGAMPKMFSSAQPVQDPLHMPSSSATMQVTGNAKDGAFAGEAEVPPSTWEGSGKVGTLNLKKKRISRILAGRTVSMPPAHLSVVTSTPSEPTEEPCGPTPRAAQLPPPESLATAQDSGEVSDVESTDSFHSIQSWHGPTGPLVRSPPAVKAEAPTVHTFPYPHDNIVMQRARPRVRDDMGPMLTPITDSTLVPSPARATHEADLPSARSVANDWKPTSPRVPEPIQPLGQSSALADRPRIRQRRSSTNNLSISSRRGLSPLPPAANLFTPPKPRRASSALGLVRTLPGALINKTVEILLSPPSHLVNLMLKVAAKIAAGEWRGIVMGFNEGGGQIPVEWDYSDGELSNWSDEEDDYPFSVSRFAAMHGFHENVSRASTSNYNSSSEDNDGGWEVD